ncbi:MAG: TonB-dependent receptor [Lysobacterales bacterium]
MNPCFIRQVRLAVLGGTLFIMSPLALAAQSAFETLETADIETVQVTATRIPLPVETLPALISVVTGVELEALGARDLRTAMSLVAGVDIASGGDGGPAGSVPGLWGLREFDAFLLVVDGVPWGGAFNPELASILLTNVDRIEVLRGSAPVMYGATSFVGVIHVIHRAAGDADKQVRVSYGSFDSASLTAVLDLPQGENYAQSLTLDGETRGFADPRAGVDRGHLLYRGAMDAGPGRLQFNVDAVFLRQDPNSPHLREGPVLAPDLPLDANYNPLDAHLDQNLYQLSGSYDRALGDLDWSTTLSLNGSSNDIVRGFLDEEYVDDGSSLNAAGFSQDRDMRGAYLDSHLLQKPSEDTQLMYGFDYLYGKAEQTSNNFDYYVPADGSSAPPSSSLPIQESIALDDTRNFYGLYIQLSKQLTPSLGLLAGLRLNHTVESRHTLETSADGTVGEGSDRLSKTRPGGMLGLSWRTWQDGTDFVSIYANYRNTYKPAAIDFGPEAESEILQPETAVSYELGLKSKLLDGQLDFDLSLFDMRFDNLVVTQSVDGRPGLTNAGKEHFQGAELEARYHLTPDLLLAGNYAWHDARFGDYEQLFGDTLTQLDGNNLEMSPQHLAALGLIYYPEQGLHGSVVWNYIGERYMNKRNTVVADSYRTWDVSLGYRVEKWDFTMTGTNLGDVRPPVAESELGESQYYRLPARSIEAFITRLF